jgi:hypothetical protein
MLIGSQLAARTEVPSSAAGMPAISAPAARCKNVRRGNFSIVPSQRRGPIEVKLGELGDRAAMSGDRFRQISGQREAPRRGGAVTECVT